MNQTRVLIHLSHFRHNIGEIQKRSKSKRLCLAVKANAYGHGATAICREAEKCSVRSFGVARVEEAVALRDAGISGQLLLLSLPTPHETAALWEYDIEPVVTDEEILTMILSSAPKDAKPKHPEPNDPKTGKRLGVHLKTDTGMGRIGCPPEKLLSLASLIKTAKNAYLAGVSTHYPLSDEPQNPFTIEQIGRMQTLKRSLANAGCSPEYFHYANSGGILFHSRDNSTMVRPGIAAYGYAPNSAFTSALADCGVELKPVMEFQAPVSFIKKVPAGTSISYGHRWTADRDTWIATINAGYGDGYPRACSGKVEVLINGRSYPQVGSICMDQCMVDLGPIS